MPAPTGPSNPLLRKQIIELRDIGHKDGSPFALRLADELARPERSRRDIDLSRIERSAESGDTVVVPGKLLADGAITKSVTIAAMSTSTEAKRKVKAAGGEFITIMELMKTNPKGRGTRIIG